MRKFLLLAALAFSSLLSTAQVTFPEPSTIATKADVIRTADSLARILRSEFIGTAPVQKVCQHGLTLVSISKQTTEGAEYNFYSVGVENLIEVIYSSSGAEIYRHRTDNVTRDRIWLPYNLSPGSYKLKIFNADCTAESKAVDFTISSTGAPIGPVPDVEPKPTGFVNPGVYSEKVGDLLYEWIPTEQVDVVITDGKVRLIAPETKKSRDGSSTCKRYVLGDLFDNKLSAADEKALFGQGIALPPGQYGFKILYLNADSWEKARANMWEMIGYSDTHKGGYRNSAGVETLQLSITDRKRLQGLDADLWRASWIPQYQLLPYSLKLPAGKVFGITRYLTNVPKDSLLAKVTHVQYTYSWLDQVDKSKAWRNQQIYGGGGIQEPKWHIDHAILNKGYILMSEYAENYGNRFGCPVCIQKSEEIYRGIYQRFVTEQGVTSPSQTWLVSDYFSHLYGGSVALNFDAGSVNLSKGLSTVHFARSSLHDGTWRESAYFTAGWHGYRNYLSQGYLDNLLGQAGKPALYSRLYNHEKANLAIPDRKKLTYTTNAQEGLHMDLATISGTWYRTKFDDGELLRADGIIHPLHTMLSDAFYALLLSDAYVIWNSNVTLNTDPATFDASWFGGYDAWKTRWKPNGGNAATYEPGKNGPVRKQADGQFPEMPMLGDQGAWLGAKIYESIADRVAELTWADYSFNGKEIIAKRGKLGNLISANGIQNQEGDNIVKLYENQLPVAIGGKGPGGEVFIFQNPHAGLTETQTVGYKGKIFQITGNRLNVFRL